MSGGVNSSVVAALMHRGRTRRHRHHAAALRSRRGHGPQGKLLRRPGHPRRAPGRRGARHSALRARLREPLCRRGHRYASPKATSPARRRSPASPAISRSSSATCSRRPRSSAPTCSRPATTFSGAMARTVRELARAVDRRPRPELFPVRHDARAASASVVPARRHAQGAKCARSPASSICPSPRRPTARTSASCRQGRYTDVIERLKPGALKPGDIVHVDGRRLGRHEGIINYTIGQRKGLEDSGPSRCTSCASMPSATRSWWDRVTACARRGLSLRNTNWLGDEPLAQAASDGLRI